MGKVFVLLLSCLFANQFTVVAQVQQQHYQHECRTTGECLLLQAAAAREAIAKRQLEEQRQNENKNNNKHPPDSKMPEEGGEDKPKPQIFALMRNGHEVIRGGVRDLEELLVEKKDVTAAKTYWEKLHEWINIHKTMEEGDGSYKGFFRLLDEHTDNTATNAQLYDLHLELDPKEAALQSALDAGDLAEAQTAFAEFAQANEAHLVREEQIMMPKVQQMVKAGLPMKQFMKQDILATVSGYMEFFVKFANQVLDKHSEGMPRARVFDHALWAVATPDEWAEWQLWIKESVSPATYQDLESIIPPSSSSS